MKCENNKNVIGIINIANKKKITFFCKVFEMSFPGRHQSKTYPLNIRCSKKCSCLSDGRFSVK